jgi:hypothetical protein
MCADIYSTCTNTCSFSRRSQLHAAVSDAEQAQENRATSNARSAHGASEGLNTGGRTPVNTGNRTPVSGGARSPMDALLRLPIVHPRTGSPVNTGGRTPIISRSRTPVDAGGSSPVDAGARTPKDRGLRSPVDAIAQTPAAVVPDDAAAQALQRASRLGLHSSFVSRDTDGVESEGGEPAAETTKKSIIAHVCPFSAASLMMQPGGEAASHASSNNSAKYSIRPESPRQSRRSGNTSRKVPPARLCMLLRHVCTCMFWSLCTCRGCMTRYSAAGAIDIMSIVDHKYMHTQQSGSSGTATNVQSLASHQKSSSSRDSLGRVIRSGNGADVPMPLQQARVRRVQKLGQFSAYEAATYEPVIRSGLLAAWYSWHLWRPVVSRRDKSAHMNPRAYTNMGPTYIHLVIGHGDLEMFLTAHAQTGVLRTPQVVNLTLAHGVMPRLHNVIESWLVCERRCALCPDTSKVPLHHSRSQATRDPALEPQITRRNGKLASDQNSNKPVGMLN